MQHEQQPAILASPPAGGDAACLTSQALEKILVYHERSKHSLERYAAGPEALDWDAQPNPFREFAGSPRIRLPLIADQLTASFADLHRSGAVVPQPLALDNVAALLELAFGLSAWKQYGPDRWAVRCNPSSGNLHPTEAYVIARQIAGLEDGVYHYLSRDHLLEQRCKLTTGASSGLLVGLSSIIWREAWKYGERAFRYCQLDTGHAIGALRYAAATLGWSLHIQNDCGHQQLAHYLGLDRDTDFTGAEREEAELLIEITPSLSATSSGNPEFTAQHWYGQANILDAHPMYRWPVIDEVAQASRKSSATLATIKPSENDPTLKRENEVRNTLYPVPRFPHPNPPPEGEGTNESLRDDKTLYAATLIRQRRSAQRFDAKFIQDLASFYHMLDALLPRPNRHGASSTTEHESACAGRFPHPNPDGITSHSTKPASGQVAGYLPEGEGTNESLRDFHVNAPWDVWQEAARIHPVLFVHRVAGLTPGIYALPRNSAVQMQMQAAMRHDFIWTKPAGCPAHLPLFLLAETNSGKAAKIMNCHQAIAGDSTFALAMLAEFNAPLTDAPWRYRELYWEAGLLGQVLYLQAEAAGLRGTGIGCFFDDTLHELLGLQDRTFQSLYHFTVGYPLTDERIANLPPYPEGYTP